MFTIALPPDTRLSIIPKQLRFRQPAGTSRGVYNIRNVWYIIIRSLTDPSHKGIGECAPLPGLSCDALPGYEYILAKLCNRLEETGCLEMEELRPYPSILFGLETAIRHYESADAVMWDTAFTRGESGIPINGLIWMGDYAQMLSRIEEKMAVGYRCVKLKIGAINFDEELALIRHIRKRYSSPDIELRVDANGAFTPAEAPGRLKQLAGLGLHSIEQPIRAGQWKEMRRLTDLTPLPIALDEELIGINDLVAKKELLDAIHPQYIILKPSLHGGISGCNEWIELARERNIGWWITSALESNIGLNAIAQWCSTFDNHLPQGLGTGQLFTDNIDVPLSIYKDALWYHRDLSDFLVSWFDNSPGVKVQTSGSTGTPKLLEVRKDKMEQSALTTCAYLGLEKGDKALLCMPVNYIAGKMMVVRALTAGLELILRKPDGYPLADVEMPLDFAAMTHLQVYNSLQIPAEAEKLKQIRTLIIGGGAISNEMADVLRAFPNRVYSTYGMTETLSHIALRRLSGADASGYYAPFPSVRLSVSDEDTLIIDAPLVSDDILYTNDIVSLLPDGSFRILGRKDNVINTGGIKIPAEAIEEKLSTRLNAPYSITSVPDEKLGEQIVLLTSREVKKEEAFAGLSAYERPRYIIKVAAIPQTATGKIDRAACRILAMSRFTALHSHSDV